MELAYITVTRMELGLANENIADGISVIHVSGELDVYGSDPARSLITKLISDGCTRLVLDVRAVDYLDSTGLAMLVGALKRTQAAGGTAVLICGSERILKIFTITGLCKVLRVFDSIQAAVQYISASPLLWNDPPGPHQYDVRWRTRMARTYSSDQGGIELVRDYLTAASRRFGLQVLFELDNPACLWLTEFVIGAGDTYDTLAERRVAEMQQHLEAQLQNPADFFDVSGLARVPADMMLQLNRTVAAKVNGVTLSRILTHTEGVAFNRGRIYTDPAKAAEFLRDPQVAG
jgi:anti-sigma B factor antagonist